MIGKLSTIDPYWFVLTSVIFSWGRVSHEPAGIRGEAPGYPAARVTGSFETPEEGVENSGRFAPALRSAFFILKTCLADLHKNSPN